MVIFPLTQGYSPHRWRQEKERLARAELRVAEEAQDRLREEQRAVLEMSPGNGQDGDSATVVGVKSLIAGEWWDNHR